MSLVVEVVRLSCHPNVVAEPVGYLTQAIDVHRWMGQSQQVVVFECNECAGRWVSDITREEWLAAALRTQEGGGK